MPTTSTRTRLSNNRLPKINWGRGRLIKHESFVSFAAKFCRLNHLTPIQFREFWKTSVNILDNDKQDNKINLIARILDEPKSIVRTVFENRYLDKNWSSMEPKSSRDWYDRISYCSECLSGCFHGNFHESDWLRKCPIHHINLTSEPLHYSPKMKIDRYLLQFLSLLDLKCPQWELLDSKYSLKANKRKLKILNKFLSWRMDAEKSAARWPKKCLGVFGSHYNYELNENNSVLSRHFLLQQLGWLTPIPDNIYDLFSDSPHYSELEITYYSRVITHELLALLSTCQWRDLLNTYKSISLPNGELHTFQKLVEAEINKIKLAHPSQNCDCTWGINKVGGLINCLPNELKYSVNYSCPYEFAANKLYDNWLNNDLKHIEISGNFIENIIISSYNRPDIVFGHSFEGRYGSKELNWSHHLSSLLKEILEKKAFAEICEISTWLASIKIDIPPNFRQRCIPNIYLVKSIRSEMQLISWPPNRYFSYE